MFFDYTLPYLSLFLTSPTLNISVYVRVSPRLLFSFLFKSFLMLKCHLGIKIIEERRCNR